jgi:hypothetical protein
VQQGLREKTAGLRERPGRTVRASWTGPAARLGLAVVFGVFLAAVGVHTAFDGPFWARAPFLSAISILAILLLNGLMVGTRRWGWPIWVRVLVICGVMVLPMGLAVWALDEVFAAKPPGLGEILPYLATSVAVSFMIGLLMGFSVWRSQGQAVAGTAAPSEPKPPRFLDRLPVKLRSAELWAVSAEDHYLRLHTSKGQDLILLRLSDAIAELDGIEGAQTHRSWWVARAAISDVRKADGAATILLPDGTEAPVSRSHAKALRERGWI